MAKAKGPSAWYEREGETELLARGLVVDAFMAEATVALALRQRQPIEWARLFIDRLHDRLDDSETQPGRAAYAQAHARAHETVDWLGGVLAKSLPYRMKRGR